MVITDFELYHSILVKVAKPTKMQKGCNAFMKEKYLELEFDVVKFDNEDIITSSGLTTLTGTGDNDVDFVNSFGE